MGFSLNKKNDSEYLTVPCFEKTGLAVHGFSQRSVPEPDKLSSVLNINPKDLTSAEQVHEAKISIIDENNKGKIAAGADAILTKMPNVPLLIRTADCVPVFLLDPKSRAVGLVHAGWKGTVLNISGKTIKKMENAFGSRPKDILAAIAPSIGPCCYEVKENVTEQLKDKIKNWEDFVANSGKGKYYLNLRKLNLFQLTEAGVHENNITVSKECTACEPDRFYSYRRDGKGTGRMFGIIMLKGF